MTETPASVPPAPVLEVAHLTTALRTLEGDVPLVDDVSFQVAPGEVLAVVGESGSGKTLTAMSIVGLLPHQRLSSTGEIRFGGRNLLTLNDKQMQTIRGREIALIPQDPMTSLNPTLTVGYQIAETLRVHLGVSARAARSEAARLLESVQIPDATRRMKAYPHEFSGGMRQRVMVAIALSCKPRLVIADEATSSLDVTTQAQVTALLRELCANLGTAMVFITHDLELVGSFCDRVIVMYSGRILESGPVSTVETTPLSPYSSRLLSAVPDPAAPRKTPLLTIEGTAPRPALDLVGCRFAPRCEGARDVCRTLEPALTERGNAHRARCWGTEEDGWLR